MYLLSEIKLSNCDEVGAYFHSLTTWLSNGLFPSKHFKEDPALCESFYSSITAVKRLLFSGRN